MSQTTSEHDLFLSLMESHQRMLFKVCWVYGANQRDDLMQEIIVRLWGAFGRYDRNRKFSTWMYRVSLNVAIDFRRRQQRWGRGAGLFDEAGAEAVATSAEEATKMQQLRELHDLLEAQSDADRALLLLYLEGNSYQEIGDVLGITETNVGTRLNRLKKSMRDAVS
ncbi:MAG TPA: sigma-70 family RNA polymerase sigma factor [Gemmatales bacterium]|nr:sigma-70 family RNA polymerase sigma factor [Gemmatales bacterium]